MAEPARPAGQPPGPPPADPFRPFAAATTIEVPLTVWPAIPGPAPCPASPAWAPCPRRYPAAAARAVIGALSRPGDLVAAPRPGDEVFLAAAASTGRVATAGAALAVVTACAVPGCPPPSPAGDGYGRAAEADPGLLFAACQRALRPGGLLVVITSAVRHPGWAGQVIAGARAAGLVYAQHVVALHAAIDDDRLCPGPPRPSSRAAAAPAQLAHLPLHTDLLLFAQPGGNRHD